MIPIYTEIPPEQKKLPALTIADGPRRGLLVQIVNPDSGMVLANLARCGGNTAELICFGGVNQAIAASGFDTDWAEWSDDGKFLRFK
jgi:hypothetical protein